VLSVIWESRRRAAEDTAFSGLLRRGFVHPDHRDRESEDEDQTSEPRLQYQTPALPAAHRGGMIDSCLRQGFKHRKHRAGRSRQTKSGAEANQNRSTTPYGRVNRSVHLARRCRCPQNRFTANDPAHLGIMAQTFGVVLIYVL
jgi:hypothetical protein